MVQTAASLTFLMNTNTGVLLNVNGFLGPLVAACAVSAHCGGRAGGWNFPLSSELVFLFSFFFPSPAELALEFEVQNDVLEVAEEALCLITPSAGFRPIIYLPLRGLLVLDGDPDCIRFAENL